MNKLQALKLEQMPIEMELAFLKQHVAIADAELKKHGLVWCEPCGKYRTEEEAKKILERVGK